MDRVPLIASRAAGDDTDRWTRIAAVTAGIGATGAVVGAICAVSALCLIVIVEGGFGELASGRVNGLLTAAAGAGALTGMFGAPLLAWGLLRRVPLGRVVLYTAIGTVLGSVIGQLLQPINPYARTVPGVIAGAFLGFLIAGVGLRLHTRLSTRTQRR